MTPEELFQSVLNQAFTGRLIRCDKTSILPAVKEVIVQDSLVDIPEEWFWSSIGNCCEMYTGNSISEQVKKTKYLGLETGYEYIATKDVSFNHTINYENGVRIPFDEDFRISHQGSVLMCIEGGSAGRKIAITDRDVCFGNKLCSFNSNFLLNKYIYYYLQSPIFKSLFFGSMAGIIGGVSIKKIKDIAIPIASIADQECIVKRIEELLPLVDKYADAYNRLEELNKTFPGDLKKSILQYAIQGKLVEQRPEEGIADDLYAQIQTDKQRLISEGKIKKEKTQAFWGDNEALNSFPETWISVTLEQITSKITDGTHKTPKYTDNGIRFVSAKNLYTGKLLFDDCKYISKDEHRELFTRCNPEKGDILISKSGSIGTVAMVDVDFEFSMFESLALVKYNHNLLDGKYLMYAIQNACFYLSDENIRGVAVKHLPISDIKKITIPLPPLKEQRRIVSCIEKILDFLELI